MQIQSEFKKASQLMNAGEIVGAEPVLRRALARHPGDVFGRFLLGTLEYRKRNYPRAIEILTDVIGRQPDFVDAYINLGSSCCEAERLDEAIDCYRHVLRTQPDNYNALNNLGSVLKKKKGYAEAQQVLEKAISIRPRFWLAHHNLGSLLCERKQYREAADHYRAALDDRADPNVLAALIGALKYCEPDQSYALAREVADQEEPGLALLAAFPLLVESCEWDLVYRILPDVLRGADNDSYPAGVLQGLLLPLNKIDGVSAKLQFKLHKLWGERAMRNIAPLKLRDKNTGAARPLRVGYVSADFREHSVGYFMRNLLVHHDRECFQVFCYSRSRTSDEVSARIRQGCHSFATIYNLTDEALAQKIRDDGVDILIDLGGHTSDTGMTVFRYKPAPVQISYLGYPNTSGLPTMDFHITDRGAQSAQGTRYTEQLLYMPESFLCFGDFLQRPRAEHTPARDTGRVTFACFNNVNKLTPATIELWSRILHAVDGAQLLIKSASTANPRVADNLYAAFEKHGIGRERIELAGYCADKAQHLDLYNRADIALDCFPYNGTTTTCEALWMGVPVVTRRGDAHVSRVSASILECIGVDATIADTDQAFVDTAVSLAADLERLDALREEIPVGLRASILCHPERFTPQFEQLLTDAWSRKMGKLPWEFDTQARAASVSHGDALSLAIAGDVSVCVPNNIGLLTPYVLLEQEDWFEVEMRFVREWLGPGMHVVDVGANYGIYTLSAARQVGPEGSVYSFEPCTDTADYLRQSIELNGFQNITLMEAGVAEKSALARLELHGNAELNAVVELDTDSGADSQSISLVSLDDTLAAQHWPDIDFLKLDAEGFEEKVIAGGKRFFDAHSPLVLYEIKHGRAWNLGLVERFAAIGYQSYRLVPGLQLLVPFDPRVDSDPMLLNLFCCKDDRAKRLAEQGRLVLEPLAPEQQPAPEVAQWVDYLARYPFAANSLDVWAGFMQANAGSLAWITHQQALDFYVVAQQQDVPAATRHAALECAYRLLHRLLASDGNLANAQSFARIAMALGRWRDAQDALQFLIQQFGQGTEGLPTEPFLPVSDMFEWIDPENNGLAWMQASVLERLEKIRAYSSYFLPVDESAGVNLESLKTLGYQSPEMERRRQLIALRGGRQTALQAAPIVAETSPYNLNARLWNSR